MPDRSPHRRKAAEYRERDLAVLRPRISVRAGAESDVERGTTERQKRRVTSCVDLAIKIG